MPNGKKYKVRVRIIEGSEGNHHQLGGWGWGWKWRAFPLLPPQKSLLVWVNHCSQYLFCIPRLCKVGGSYLNMQGLNINCGIDIVPKEAPNEKANIGE